MRSDPNRTPAPGDAPSVSDGHPGRADAALYAKAIAREPIPQRQSPFAKWLNRAPLFWLGFLLVAILTLALIAGGMVMFYAFRLLRAGAQRLVAGWRHAMGA